MYKVYYLTTGLLVIGLVLIVFLVSKTEAQEQALATLPSYDSKCVELLENTNLTVDTQAQAIELTNCIKKFSLQKYNPNLEPYNFHTQNYPMSLNNWINKTVKWHIQSTNSKTADINTKVGKIRVDDSKTLVEIKAQIK